MKIVADGERVEIYLSKKAAINFDELKCVVSQSSSLFIECIYCKLKSSNNFIYYNNRLQSMENGYISNDEQLFAFIDSLILLVEICRTNRLMLKNIIVDKKCVFVDDGLYKFIYLPIEQSNDISVKNLFLKFMKLIQYRSEKCSQITKVIKRSSYENCIKNTSDLIGEYKKSKAEKNAFDKYETLSLVSESETTLLQKNTDNIYEVSECETSILSSENLKDYTQDSSLAETTVILQNKQSSDPETTILTNNGFEYDSNPAETNLLNLTAVNKFASINMSYLKRIDTGQIIYITKPTFVIGKDASFSDYCINNASVSRNHASILCEEDKFYVVDNDSTNGTIVEGVRISPHEKVEIFSGSIISFSGETFQFFIGRGNI